ncbi:Methyltransferase domain-containing protein [Aquimarina amphilecti]|uniref:Methyltransferase domain-containing protein n=1 Tax=Aquimarina amphilecti TaxID=1038014 RepID=A0A1H7JYB9_AQUAM|nr:class I SAM-dependent methyltransferase [Aquimarina amphilecti]SEK78757.1 Methyltransferase domain-containing protein [Aquimarina amphilecti]
MNKEELDFYIKCEDFTVSGESFKLYKDKDLDMLVTLPKPANENLGKYYESEDYISHTDSKRSVFEKLYHYIKKYSLNKKVKLISTLNKGSGSLLDIGAGTGDFLIQADLKYWKVKGVEPSVQAKELAKEKGILLESDTADLPSHEYDVITMWHVLEHVPDLTDQIKELKRLVKPGGYVVIAVPNFKSFDAEYYNSYWAAYDVPRHLWHFSKNSIKALFAKEDIYLEKTLPLIFDSFYVALLSEKYKNGTMNYIRAVWIGFISNFKAKQSKEYSSHIYILKNS